ncbi:metallophosphoesterase [Clostridium intestinale]|uniref:Putative phosphohydrolase n=1 Tax=Clostridium intestinale URNW TaxID=1294142 RepID=U2N798_9CLOT|nr:metallophosphoesterase [Clostridium intestinale]ERK31387.1 putative phosphohydrolase [Clostridium intestinale URNW]
MKFERNKLLFSIIILVVIAFLVIVYNKKIVISNITYKNSKIPSSFDGYKILQISDLHNAEFGKNQKTLIEKTKEIAPDIIFITGDLIDSYNTNIDISMKYIDGIADIAPIYFIPGNHESRIESYNELCNKLISFGVKILNNKTVFIQKDTSSIGLIGLDDPAFIQSSNQDELFKKLLIDLSKDTDSDFKILLSHRPEKLADYKDAKVDLVFSGHAHGGQFRIPFVGGLLAPNQGFFPKYTSGIYREENTSMIVSSGLGNSIFPFRINNSPELVVVTLEK